MAQHDTDSADPRTDDPIISRSERDRLAKDAFNKTAQTISKSEIGKTKKLFGLWEMDAGIVDIADGFYNIGADYLANILRPKIFGIVEKVAPRLGVPEKYIKSLAAVSAVSGTVVVKVGGYFGPIWDGFSTQLKEQNELAHKISPVLDDLQGNHSFAALHLARGKNTVLEAHMARMNRIADAKHTSNFLSLAVNAGSLAFDGTTMWDIWKNRDSHNEISIKKALAAKQKKAQEEGSDASQGMFLIKTGTQTLLPQIASRINATNKYKLANEMQPYSALEMITELADQISSNPKTRGFMMPKSYQNPKARPEEYPLEEYLMRICIQHQKEMAELKPDHTEIREALRDDLAAAIKPVAEAIRKGDLSTMSLIRLVGEGKIIKKQGRDLATPEEVSDLVAQEAPKQLSYANVSPAEYFKDAVFSRAQLKEALKALDGDEKAQFAALFHDAVLADAGMDKKEIKAMREATLKHYDSRLCELVLGLNAQSDAELQKDGLSHGEIEHLRKAAAHIESHGEQGIHDLKASPANDNGIEHLLANVIVPHVVQHPQYMGKLAASGHHKLVEVAANDDGHAGREERRRVGAEGVEHYRD